MTAKDILKLLDPKNQNLPKITIDSDYKKYSRINLIAFEGKENELKKSFPCLKKVDFSAKPKEVKEMICDGKGLWIHPLGKEDEISAREARRLFGKIYLSSLAGNPEKIAIMCPMKWVRSAAIGIHVAALNAGIFKSKNDKKKVPEVVLVNYNFAKKSKEANDALSKGLIEAESKNMMRTLGAIPANILTTKMYAEVIKLIAKQWKLPCVQLSTNEVKKHMLLDAVSWGSKFPSQLLVITINPKKGKTKESTALIGKGLCFDAGGLQDKQSYMKYMKEDMSGSASVLGTINNIVKNKYELKETTHFLMPLAENMMGSGAMRPDDVITASDGQTVEIMNTDAEGRLILADTICYAKKNFKNVRRYMTIATLTGSCVIALGDIYTGAICNDEKFADEIKKSAKESGDLVSFAPWDLEYDDNNSPVADMGNLGEKDRDAGWIKAGLFLYKFVPKSDNPKKQAQFCHFDIAGTIDMKESGKAWRRKGLTSGVGVSLLSRLLTK